MAMSSAEKSRAFRERQRARMAEDPEYAAEVKARKAVENKQWRQQNKEHANEYRSAWHAERMLDPEYVEYRRQKNSEWRANNPEKRQASSRESTRRRKALLKGASEVEFFTKPQIWDRDSGICGLCGKAADPTDWHLDHVIPLKRGGEHTMENVQVSHPKCNLSKGAKIIP